MSAQKAGCRFDGAQLDFLSDEPRASRGLDVDGGRGADSWTDQQVVELEDQVTLILLSPPSDRVAYNTRIHVPLTPKILYNMTRRS